MDLIQAILAINPKAECYGSCEVYDQIAWVNNTIPIPKEQVLEKLKELKSAEPMRLLRIERDRRLAETDWVTLKAYSQGVEVHPIWKNYMQALRDLPYVCIHMTDDVPKLDEQGNLINVPWPDVPEQHHMKDY